MTDRAKNLWDNNYPSNNDFTPVSHVKPSKGLWFTGTQKHARAQCSWRSQIVTLYLHALLLHFSHFFVSCFVFCFILNEWQAVAVMMMMMMVVDTHSVLQQRYLQQKASKLIITHKQCCKLKWTKIPDVSQKTNKHVNRHAQPRKRFSIGKQFLMKYGTISSRRCHGGKQRSLKPKNNNPHCFIMSETWCEAVSRRTVLLIPRWRFRFRMAVCPTFRGKKNKHLAFPE